MEIAICYTSKADEDYSSCISVGFNHLIDSQWATKQAGFVGHRAYNFLKFKLGLLKVFVKNGVITPTRLCVKRYD